MKTAKSVIVVVLASAVFLGGTVSANANPAVVAAKTGFEVLFKQLEKKGAREAVEAGALQFGRAAVIKCPVVKILDAGHGMVHLSVTSLRTGLTKYITKSSTGVLEFTPRRSEATLFARKAGETTAAQLQNELFNQALIRDAILSGLTP